MQSRLDRYNNNSNQETPSRLVKNKNLYDELNNKIGFEEIVDFNTQTKIELSTLNDPKKSRESYQQLKDYQKLIAKEEKEKVIEPEEENKVFDINTILEEARKNRHEIDELEKRRNLKNEEYNALSDLNKKYVKDKEDKDNKDKYEGLEELINTITSKTLVNDIKVQELKEASGNDDKGLLGDLVATNVDLRVQEPSQYESEDAKLIKENDDSKNLENDDMVEEKTIDESFYTRSMDLSKDDFDLDDDSDGSSSTKKIILITLVVILLIVIIAVVGFFICKAMGTNILDYIKF